MLSAEGDGAGAAKMTEWPLPRKRVVMANNGQARSLAVLIDADNTTARYAHPIFDEIVKLGEANVKRIYGDFSGNRLASWDSDFTRLAQRLREDGLVVYGFGERKTPEAFRNACNRFIYAENLVGQSEDESSGAADAGPDKKESPKKAASIIARAIEDADDDGWAHLGGVGSRIQGAAPDFDPRTYGCPNLSTLVAKSGGFEVRRGPGNAIHIRRKALGRKAAAGRGN